MAEMRYILILNAWGGKCFWIWQNVFCWIIIKKWHFAPSETMSFNWLAVYLKEKGKCLPHTLKQKYRRYFFLTSSRPWHALHFLLWTCNSDLPTTRFNTKSVLFVCFFCFCFFAFCPLYQMQILFSTLFLSCVHTYILHCIIRSVWPGCILIHLGKRGTWYLATWRQKREM